MGGCFSSSEKGIQLQKSQSSLSQQSMQSRLLLNKEKSDSKLGGSSEKKKPQQQKENKLPQISLAVASAAGSSSKENRVSISMEQQEQRVFDQTQREIDEQDREEAMYLKQRQERAMSQGTRSLQTSQSTTSVGHNEVKSRMIMKKQKRKSNSEKEQQQQCTESTLNHTAVAEEQSYAKVEPSHEKSMLQQTLENSQRSTQVEDLRILQKELQQYVVGSKNDNVDFSNSSVSPAAAATATMNHVNRIEADVQVKGEEALDDNCNMNDLSEEEEEEDENELLIKEQTLNEIRKSLASQVSFSKSQKNLFASASGTAVVTAVAVPHSDGILLLDDGIIAAAGNNNNNNNANSNNNYADGILSHGRVDERVGGGNIPLSATSGAATNASQTSSSFAVNQNQNTLNDTTDFSLLLCGGAGDSKKNSIFFGSFGVNPIKDSRFNLDESIIHPVKIAGDNSYTVSKKEDEHQTPGLKKQESTFDLINLLQMTSPTPSANSASTTATITSNSVTHANATGTVAGQYGFASTTSQQYSTITSGAAAAIGTGYSNVVVGVGNAGVAATTTTIIPGNGTAGVMPVSSMIISQFQYQANSSEVLSSSSSKSNLFMRLDSLERRQPTPPLQQQQLLSRTESITSQTERQFKDAAAAILNNFVEEDFFVANGVVSTNSAAVTVSSNLQKQVISSGEKLSGSSGGIPRDLPIFSIKGLGEDDEQQLSVQSISSSTPVASNDARVEEERSKVAAKMDFSFCIESNNSQISLKSPVDGGIPSNEEQMTSFTAELNPILAEEDVTSVVAVAVAIPADYSSVNSSSCTSKNGTKEMLASFHDENQEKQQIMLLESNQGIGAVEQQRIDQTFGGCQTIMLGSSSSASGSGVMTATMVEGNSNTNISIIVQDPRNNTTDSFIFKINAKKSNEVEQQQQQQQQMQPIMKEVQRDSLVLKQQILQKSLLENTNRIVMQQQQRKFSLRSNTSSTGLSTTSSNTTAANSNIVDSTMTTPTDKQGSNGLQDNFPLENVFSQQYYLEQQELEAEVQVARRELEPLNLKYRGLSQLEQNSIAFEEELKRMQVVQELSMQQFDGERSGGISQSGRNEEVEKDEVEQIVQDSGERLNNRLELNLLENVMVDSAARSVSDSKSPTNSNGQKQQRRTSITKRVSQKGGGNSGSSPGTPFYSCINTPNESQRSSVIGDAMRRNNFIANSSSSKNASIKRVNFMLNSPISSSEELGGILHQQQLQGSDCEKNSGVVDETTRGDGLQNAEIETRNRNGSSDEVIENSQAYMEWMKSVSALNQNGSIEKYFISSQVLYQLEIIKQETYQDFMVKFEQEYFQNFDLFDCVVDTPTAKVLFRNELGFDQERLFIVTGEYRVNTDSYAAFFNFKNLPEIQAKLNGYSSLEIVHDDTSSPVLIAKCSNAKSSSLSTDFVFMKHFSFMQEQLEGGEQAEEDYDDDDHNAGVTLNNEGRLKYQMCEIDISLNCEEIEHILKANQHIGKKSIRGELFSGCIVTQLQEEQMKQIKVEFMFEVNLNSSITPSQAKQMYRDMFLSYFESLENAF